MRASTVQPGHLRKLFVRIEYASPQGAELPGEQMLPLPEQAASDEKIERYGGREERIPFIQSCFVYCFFGIVHVKCVYF